VTGLLRFAGVEHDYGAEPVLRGVDLDLAAGEILAVLGPSGCGKSTLLRVAAGLEPVRGGRVVLDGATVAEPGTTVPPEHRRLGMVFQDFALFPHRDVDRNLAFGLSGMDRDAKRRRVDELLARVGLGDFARRYPHTLSGGQQQRVALARALAPRPHLILMDEPFSGLDAALRFHVREETLGLLRAEGIGALMVTHDAEEAMHVADRLVLLRDGRVVQEGTGEAIYLHPADREIAASFGEVDVLPAAVDGTAVCTPIGEFPLPEGIDAPVEFVVRHEALRPEPGGPLKARVERSRIVAGGRLTLLRVGDGEESTRVHMRHRRDAAITPGAEIRCAVDPELVHIFRLKAEG